MHTWKSQISVASIEKMWPGLVLLLHLLISQDKMMRVEAAMCSAPSKLFHGLCFSDSNCARICEKEGYLSGNCKGMLMKCICFKDCGGGGGGGPPQKPPEEPPDTPPEDPPPEETPDTPPTGPPSPDPPPPTTPCPSPPSGCPQPPVSPCPNPPTGCPNPPIGCPNPPCGCPHPPGKS